MSPQKVLVINTLGLNYEGITTVLFNYLSNMNRDNLTIDFITYDGMNPELKKSFEKIGSIIVVPRRKTKIVEYIITLYHILGNGYNVVHINGNSGTMVIESLLSKSRGIKNVIVHCHSNACSYPLLNNILVPFMKAMSDKYVACSQNAGNWLFHKSDFFVLNNAINLKHYKYNSDVRKKYRSILGIDNDFVIGHVGNFYEQKNHAFLLDVFSEVYSIRTNQKLLLVGDGPELDKIKEKTISLGLEDAVIFAGRRNDVECLYQAMDIFCFPSKREGFGMVTLEAQAADLPLLVSDGVPMAAKCSDKMYYKPLSDGPISWARMLIEIENLCSYRDGNSVSDISLSGFDIKTEAEKLKQLYLH